MFGFLRSRRRRRVGGMPVPGTWMDILRDNAPLLSRLPPDDRTELLGHLQVLLAEKRFEGAGGLAMTDEVRVTVAAHASLLLLHRQTAYYPRLVSVVVYPAEFLTKQTRAEHDWLVSEEEESRSGESWREGTLILSWEDVVISVRDPDDGYNVILHEFAHQLDEEDGTSDGTPPLPDRRMYLDWRRVMEKEFRLLKRDAARGRDTLLDPYGAEAPAEFFAVATEHFFETPLDLREEHSELYALLKRYYNQDPATWDHI